MPASSPPDARTCSREYDELMNDLEPDQPNPHTERVAEPRTKYGGFKMTDDYEQWIAEIEALPQNQSGADKTWVGELLRMSAEHFARARRIR